MNVLLLLAHAVEEYDQVRLLTSLGYDVFSIGGYDEPAHPAVDLRPPILDAPDHPELRQACWERRHEHRDDPMQVNGRDIVDWAKYDLPDAVLDWADTIIVHHFEHTWLVPQWERLKASGKRIVWRTVGQSVENNERMMAPLVADGLEVLRYSPKERNIPGFAGETALIRFWADPDEWCGWTGDIPAVINITQDLFRRSLADDGAPQPAGKQFTNYSFWTEATKGLPSVAMGPGSEAIGGTGSLPFETMQEMLRRGRCYLYTGTQPASYTLGLIEAMMTGIPVVSIGPTWMRIFPFGPELFEGHEIALAGSDSPLMVKQELRNLLAESHTAQGLSDATRARAIELFGRQTIAAQWREFLG